MDYQGRFGRLFFAFLDSTICRNYIIVLLFLAVSWPQGSKLWIIMEYLGGGSALDLLKAGKMDEVFIATILREILYGLNYLHTERTLHRDIKGKTCDLKLPISDHKRALKHLTFWSVGKIWFKMHGPLQVDEWISFGEQNIKEHNNNNNNMDLYMYSARIHQLSGAQGALLPLLIRLIHHSWNHLSSLGSIQLNCCHYSAYRAGANQPTLPSQVPI